MLRQFGYITPGFILLKLKKQGLSISRVTFYKMEKAGLFTSQKAMGGWRVYTPQQMDRVIDVIRQNYGFEKLHEELIPEEKIQKVVKEPAREKKEENSAVTKNPESIESVKPIKTPKTVSNVPKRVSSPLPFKEEILTTENPWGTI